MSGEGRGEGVDADATATPPEERTSLRRAGECAAADATVDAGAVVGRSGDDGAADVAGAKYDGDAADAGGGGLSRLGTEPPPYGSHLFAGAPDEAAAGEGAAAGLLLGA